MKSPVPQGEGKGEGVESASTNKLDIVASAEAFELRRTSLQDRDFGSNCSPVISGHGAPSRCLAACPRNSVEEPLRV